MRGEPGIVFEAQLGSGTPTEIDRGSRERVVHRDDGIAVACNAPAVAQGRVQCLAERESRVLCRVVLAGLEVAVAYGVSAAYECAK